MAGKKIKIEEQAISKILTADTDSNHPMRLAMLKNTLRNKNNKNNNKPPQKSKYRLQQVVDSQPRDHLKEGRQIFILLLV
jgi:hypothetical protein